MNRARDSFPPLEVLFGRTQQMARVRELLLSSNRAIPVLIQGESGTGKEVIAQFIAAASPAQVGFVKVSCPAIPSALLETELFGYEKGAFTGAHSAKRGRVELADNGILFLDEIGELDLSVQAKLLQLLQDGRYCRVGGHEERQVSVRVMSATNRNLREEVAAGLFRRDLLYRINAVTVELPPLRDRIVDLPVLVDFFLERYSAEFNRTPVPLSSETLQVMAHYHWPGNIRELENLIRRYVILPDEDGIAAEMMSSQQAVERFVAEIEVDTKLSLKELTRRAVQDLERQVILRMLKAHNWNRKKTAAALNISYRGLIYKMREAGFPRLTNVGSNQAAPAD